MRFSQLMRVLRAHSGIIVLTVCCALALAILITATMTPKYVATSSALVDMPDMASSSPNQPQQPYSSFVATQIDLLTSQTVALKVIDRLHIADDPSARRRILGPESRIAKQLRALKAHLQSVFGETPQQEKQLETNADDNDVDDGRYVLADRLLKKISVHPSPDSNVLQINFAAPSARAASEGANAVVKAYVDTTLELNVNPARASSEWLDAQVQRLTVDAQKARAKVTEFQQRNGIIDVGGSDDGAGRLADLNSQLVAAQAQNHPAIQALKSDLTRAREKLNELPPQLGPNHPAYKRAQSEVAILEARVEQESAQLAERLRQAIDTQKVSMLHMKREQAQLVALKDAADNTQHALDDATQRASQARMNSQVTQANVSVVRVATPPPRPTTPNPGFNFLLAIAVGIALGLGLALWREVVCRFVRSADDLRDFLGIPVLGVLHSGPRSSSGRPRLPNNYAPLLTANR